MPKYKFRDFIRTSLPRPKMPFNPYKDLRPGMKGLYIHLTPSGNPSKKTKGPITPIEVSSLKDENKAWIQMKDTTGWWYTRTIDRGLIHREW